MRLGLVSSFLVRRAMGRLRRRACSPAHFEQLVATSTFRNCDVTTQGIGMGIRLKKA